VCGRAYRYQDGQVQKDKKGEMSLMPHKERATSVLSFELFATEEWVWTSSVLVRKTVLYRAGLFENCLKVDEDYALWTKIARYTEFWFFNAMFGCYRLHEANVTNDAEAVDFYNVLSKRLQMVLWSSEPHIAKLYEKRIGRFFASRAWQYRAEENYKKVARYYWLATWHTNGLKHKGKFFAMFLIAMFFPFVFRMWDKRRNSR